MPDEDDGRALRERVRALEQMVQEQQSTIEQLMPSRRAILAGGAGLVGGAALTGQASAQSAAGQVGTTSEPVDVEAATLNATDVNTGSVNTNNATINGVLKVSEIDMDTNSSGSTFLNSNETTVPADTDTIVFLGARVLWVVVHGVSPQNNFIFVDTLAVSRIQVAEINKKDNDFENPPTRTYSTTPTTGLTLNSSKKINVTAIGFRVNPV